MLFRHSFGSFPLLFTPQGSWLLITCKASPQHWPLGENSSTTAGPGRRAPCSHWLDDTQVPPPGRGFGGRGGNSLVGMCGGPAPTRDQANWVGFHWLGGVVAPPLGGIKQTGRDLIGWEAHRSCSWARQRESNEISLVGSSAGTTPGRGYKRKIPLVGSSGGFAPGRG